MERMQNPPGPPARGDKMDAVHGAQSSAGMRGSRFSARIVIAEQGQTALHFPQRMHSGLLMFFRTSTFMGQFVSQALQRMHFFWSRFIWKKLKRLNSP